MSVEVRVSTHSHSVRHESVHGGGSPTRPSVRRRDDLAAFSTVSQSCNRGFTMLAGVLLRFSNLVVVSAACPPNTTRSRSEFALTASPKAKRSGKTVPVSTLSRASCVFRFVRISTMLYCTVRTTGAGSCVTSTIGGLRYL